MAAITSCDSGLHHRPIALPGKSGTHHHHQERSAKHQPDSRILRCRSQHDRRSAATSWNTLATLPTRDCSLHLGNSSIPHRPGSNHSEETSQERIDSWVQIPRIPPVFPPDSRGFMSLPSRLLPDGFCLITWNLKEPSLITVSIARSRSIEATQRSSNSGSIARLL